jgi:murein DD-endopeptidase MepM/ murein hydrolase activator NlpD
MGFIAKRKTEIKNKIIKKLLTALVFSSGGLILLAFCVFAAVMSQVAANEVSMQSYASGESGISIPITIDGKIDGNSAVLDIDGTGISINGLTGSFSGGVVQVSASASGLTQMPLPASPPATLSSFSYMPHFDQSLYTMKLDKTSAQYKFNQNCTTDGEGFRRFGSAYLIALGTYYGRTIGEKYQLTFRQDDGSELVIDAVRGDTKADKDTDANHQYHMSDKTVVEFIMGGRGSQYHTTVNNKFGQLISITKSGMAVTLTGTVSGSKISFTGFIDGMPVSASGTISGDDIQAAGVWGTTASGASSSGSGAFGWPLNGSYPITSLYGYRLHPLTGIYTLHAGVDIGCPTGTPVYASDSGTVILAVSSDTSSAGKHVKIDHKNGKSSIYMHLDSLNVSIGATVAKGQLIAYSGNTGGSTGSHLHFEIREGAVSVDPFKYVSAP